MYGQGQQNWDQNQGNPYGQQAQTPQGGNPYGGNPYQTPQATPTPQSAYGGSNFGMQRQVSPQGTSFGGATPMQTPMGSMGGGWDNSAPTPQNQWDNNDFESKNKGHSSAPQGGQMKVMQDLFRVTPAVGAVYVFMAVVTVAGFFFVSDGEMSAILVLASLLTTISHMFVLLEVVTTKSASSVNVPSQILLAIVYITRLPALCFADQYLPVDSTGDWAYQFFEFASFVAACLTIYLAEVQFKRPADPTAEETKEKIPWWAAIPAAALMAFIFPCARIRRFALDWGWTFSCYLEAFARVPQVMQVARTNNPVAPNVGHSLVLMFFARIFTAWFYYNYSSAYKINKAGSMVVWLICLSQLSQLFLLVDFVYCYVKHIMKSGMNFYDQGIAIHEV